MTSAEVQDQLDVSNPGLFLGAIFQSFVTTRRSEFSEFSAKRVLCTVFSQLFRLLPSFYTVWALEAQATIWQLGFSKAGWSFIRKYILSRWIESFWKEYESHIPHHHSRR